MAEITLPPLTDERIDEIEQSLFADIARDQLAAATKRGDRAVRRGRVWMGGAAAAAFVAVAALIGPAIAGGPSGVSTASGGMPLLPATMEDSAAQFADGSAEAIDGAAGDAALREMDAPAAGDAEREIITMASASVAVDDVTAGVAAVSALATDAGGFVESLSVGSAPVPIEQLERGMTLPTDSQLAWLTVRVPAAALSSVIDSLSGVGTVTAQNIDRHDVTTESVDLRARIGSLEASVQRLTELMAGASSTADLLAAEQALSERQAELESLKQQLTSLSSQVEMSSLTVSVTRASAPAATNPAGFGDGLLAGWNGLIATLNGTVIGVGFLLPWIAVAAVAFVIVWGLRRMWRRRGGRGGSASVLPQTPTSD